MWSHMFHRNIQVAFSKFSGCFYIDLFFELQHFTSDQSRQRCPVRQRNSKNDSLKSSSACDTDKDQKKHMWDSHNQIYDPCHNGICCFSHCCRYNPQNECHDRTERSCTYSYDDTDRKSSDCPRKHISSKPVCTKRIFQAGCNVLSGKICCPCRIFAEQTADTDCCKKHHCDNKPEYQCFSAIPSVIHLPTPPLRIRGSMTPYKIFAIKFPPNTNNALMIVIAIRSGISLPRPALTAACPSPG